MRLRTLTFTVEDDNGRIETVEASFDRSNHSWFQGGAREPVLWETVPVLDAIQSAAETDPEVYAFVFGGRTPEGQDHFDRHGHDGPCSRPNW